MPNIMASVACKVCLPTQDGRLFIKLYCSAHTPGMCRCRCRQGQRSLSKNDAHMQWPSLQQLHMCITCSDLWPCLQWPLCIRGIEQFWKLSAILNRETTLLRGHVNITGVKRCSSCCTRAKWLFLTIHMQSMHLPVAWCASLFSKLNSWNTDAFYKAWNPAWNALLVLTFSNVLKWVWWKIKQNTWVKKPWIARWDASNTQKIPH